MKNSFSPTKIVASLTMLILAAALSGCSALSPGGADADPCNQARYDGNRMEPYVDATHQFRLCVPKHLMRSNATGASDGRVVFSGFAVPPGVNLEAKALTIVPGAYEDLQGATAFGHFTAGGVTFQRAKLDDGSAGHSTLHVIYTWTTRGRQVHFDFTHRSVNPLLFDPGHRPAPYDKAAQIKLTEEIMSTFTPLN